MDKTIVVLDIECFERGIVKELGVYIDGVTRGYSFKPISSDPSLVTRQNFWITQNMHLIEWNSGAYPYIKLWHVLNSIGRQNDFYFAN